MKNYFKYLATFALILALLCLLGALMSGLGVRFAWWGVGTGFIVLKWSVYLAGIPVLLVLVAVMLAKIQGTRLQGVQHFVALLIALLVFGVPYQIRAEFLKTPTLADATTSFDDAPAFVDLVAVREATSQNPLAYRGGDAVALQQRHFPRLVSMQVAKPPTEVIALAAAYAKQQGMEIVAIKPEEGRLEATATTFWFGFKDDVVVRARLQESGKTVVDVRSASRVGYLDGGVNGKRVLGFLAYINGQ